MRNFVLIALGKHGVGGVVQDGRETLIRPGEFAIYDTTRPYELHFDDAFTQTILQGAARDAAAADRGNGSPDRDHLRRRSSRCRSLRYDFVYQLCQSADRIGPEHGDPPVRAGRRPGRDGA